VTQTLKALLSLCGQFYLSANKQPAKGLTLQEELPEVGCWMLLVVASQTVWDICVNTGRNVQLVQRGISKENATASS
jgi:hypothetical protein